MEIRAFDGLVGDAEGVIAVDGETFGDCRYTPHYVVELVATGGQCVWVAEAEESLVGFVSAFTTHSLSGDRWEIDELAVRPYAQGQGIGTALIRRAMEEAPPVLPSRAVIATSNAASQRAFAKNGFSPGSEKHLLVRDALLAHSAVRSTTVPIRCATWVDAEVLAKLSKRTIERTRSCLEQADNVYLIADSNQGYVELLRVRTMQYTGFWLESIQCTGQDPHLIHALLDAAVALVCEKAMTQEIDLVGHLAYPEKSAFYQACTAQQFAKIGEYQAWMT